MVMAMMRMNSVLLADANERISAGSLRIGTGVNILPQTSTPSFSLHLSSSANGSLELHPVSEGREVDLVVTFLRINCILSV